MLQVKFREGPARASCERLNKAGLVEAQYSGPMNERAFALLRQQALMASADTTVYVVRLDKALILMGDEAPVDENSYQNDAPGALVVRHDPVEYARWTAYARECARHGVIRTVWTERFAALAYRWAQLRSAVSLQAKLH